jgi:Dyp-type peroxidase family
MAANPLRKKGSRVETTDVQGLVLQGYGKLRAAAYLVLQLPTGPDARSWLRTVLPEVSLGSDRPATVALNLALSASGLDKLGLPRATIDGFSPEFLEGMTSTHRSRLLGDEGDAAPARWSWGAPGGPDVDALLLAYARDDEGLRPALDHLRSGLAARGVREVASLETQDIGRGEHFGFRDGLSQPAMSGVGRRTAPMHTVAPGEFLLGYLNEHGQYPRSPLVTAAEDGSGVLPARPRGQVGAVAPVPPGWEDAHDFGRNGSYLVVRTLEQDVGSFWRFVDRMTRGSDAAPDAEARTALAARMVGRWPSGAPVTRSPDKDRPELAEDNDFGYDAEDRDGTRCPIGAHVRRTNPRDSLPPKPGTSASIDVGKRHRLIRRGRTYGPPISPEAALVEGPGRVADRGLHFLALCADIARQFEFVSHTWVMNPSFAGLLDDADPLLGGHAGRGSAFTVQADPVRQRYREVPAVVTPRGGAYFFLPGGRALQYLASR